VKLIGEFCFWGCHGLTGTLMIPNSVEYIGRNAFAYCTGFTGDLIINILDETSIIGLYPFAGNSESHMAMHIKRIIVPYLAQKPNT
jgi:hypothetical protein